ncbi:MAG: hypothetical protein AAGH92_09945 [Planctomycetota bacterium]
MPRRNAKPPYEILRQSPPTAPPAVEPRNHLGEAGSKPAGFGAGRGRRVLRLPDASTLVSALRQAGSACIDKARDGWAALRERVGALRTLWAQRREEHAVRRAEAQSKRVKVGESAAGAWWITSGKPVVLRMTRGLVVLSIAGFVGLVLLAYWLGGSDRSVGFADTWPPEDPNALAYANGEETARAGNTSLPGSQPTVIDVPGGSDPDTGLVVPTPRTTPPPAADPRLPGRNYLVYTMTDLGTARELAEFLRGEGARILIVPTEHRLPQTQGEVATADESGDTAVLHLVVDVTEGYSRAAYARGEHHRFLSERLALGRAWKRHNGDRGSALESMTFYKYNAPRD